jgi:hypothetical protein
MSEKIDAKREEELVWIRWARLLGIVGFTAKYVLAGVFYLLARHLISFPQLHCPCRDYAIHLCYLVRPFLSLILMISEYCCSVG